MKAIYKYDGPLGTYALEEQNGLLTRLWLGDRMALLPGETEISETPLLKEAHRQLTAYFAREQKQFDLPIAPEHLFNSKSGNYYRRFLMAPRSPMVNWHAEAEI